jgi:signal transduction histidine kinase
MNNTPLSHILLVEDNPADARLIEEYLIERSWPDIDAEAPTIQQVDNLNNAVETFDDQVDIVLLDLGLPDSSGLETLDQMVAVDEMAPVVVLTGLDDERVGVNAVEQGAQDYLVKDDITPRLLQQTLRYARQREQQQQKLQQRNAELALLNQVVRHDIRNDVAVILGWGDSLKNHVDDTGAEHLDRMLRAGEHITSITETVGDFLDVLENNSDPELHSINLSSVLTNEIEKAQSAHEEATITLTGDLPQGLEVAATELLSSVFRNLLNNAVSHNDKPEPEIAVHVEENDETVSVQVADNGPGVPDSQKNEVFGRGEMGLASSGSGIGLYLVDTLVGTYDGEVVLEDNEPEGSVFTVTLEKY